MNMRALIAGFVIAFGISEIALSAPSLSAQDLEFKPSLVRPELAPDLATRWGTERPSNVRPGLNEPHIISRFSLNNEAGQVGIAGWTSTNPPVLPGHPSSGDRAGSIGFGLAGEWGAQPSSAKHLTR